MLFAIFPFTNSVDHEDISSNNSIISQRVIVHDSRVIANLIIFASQV